MNIIMWLDQNKEWIFSGLGVTIVVTIFTIIKKRIEKNKDEKSKIIIKQVNEGQDNTQIGIQNNYGTKQRSD